MMTCKDYNTFLEAVDVVCDRCTPETEESCTKCYVRKTCDRLSMNQQTVAGKCADCIPEVMTDCKNCTRKA